MKPKKQTNKLTINKNTVAHLNASESGQIKAGKPPISECDVTCGTCIGHCRTSNEPKYTCDTQDSWCV